MKVGQIGGGLVLLAEDVVLVLVENLAIAASERDRSHHGNEEAGRLLGGGVVGQRRDVLLENCPVQHGVGFGALRSGVTRKRVRVANSRITASVMTVSV